MQETLHELRTFQIELELQNEELRRTQFEADTARARYFDLYDLAPAGYCTLNEAGLILEANLTSATQLGVERGALAGQPITRFIFREDQDLYYLHRRQLFETESPQACDLRMQKVDGSRFWVHVAVTVVRGDDGVPVCRLVMSDITEQKKGEEALAVSEANLHSLIEGIEDIVVSRDQEGRVVAWNEAFASLVRRVSGNAAGPGPRIGDRLPPVELQRWEGILAKVHAGEVHREEFSRDIDGRPRHFEMSLTPIRVGGKVIGSVEFTRDITERRRTEEHLRQALKMETVGQLAGGVAHDFNNMLQVILGNVEIMRGKVEAGGGLEKHLLEIRHAAQRSADLTGQLLAFARRQPVNPKVIDLNEAVVGTQNLLQRLIGEDIHLVWHPGEGLWKVSIDPAQLDQVLANLAINARDAIPHGGTVTVGTRNLSLGEEYGEAHPEVSPGDYVRLAVSDDGRGMDLETMGHLFEPFFTTKGLGRGTGLGLATIYGIVKQNRGFIDVSSEPDKGSTFSVYLPRVEGDTTAPEIETIGMAPGGTETVLLVEDEAAILEIAMTSLETLGYTVLSAGSPEEALRRAAGHGGGIHLLVADVVMPGMNGRQLYDRLREVRPGLKCLYLSGYTAEVIAHRGLLEEGVSFLAKPFPFSSLARKVREVLDG